MMRANHESSRPWLALVLPLAILVATVLAVVLSPAAGR